MFIYKLTQRSPIPGPRDRYRSVGHLVPGRTETIKNLHYLRFYLLSESERCFILKNDQILSVTSVYDSLLTHVKTLVSVMWYATAKISPPIS